MDSQMDGQLDGQTNELLAGWMIEWTVRGMD